MKYLVIDLSAMSIHCVESNYYDAVISAICYAKKRRTVAVVVAEKKIVYRVSF